MLAFRMLQSGRRPGEYLLTIGSRGTSRGFAAFPAHGGLAPSVFEGNPIAQAFTDSNTANNFYVLVRGNYSLVSCRLVVPGLTDGVNASGVYDEKPADTRWSFSVPGAYSYLNARVGTTIPFSFRRN